MLQELSINNFAIIDELYLSFDNGLTVLTGETGAGKSIIIDALHLLTGGRGSAEYVRYGEKKAELEGLFIVHDHHMIHEKLAEFGIDIEDGMIIIRRDISSSGKSVCRVNGKLVTIAMLREIGSKLVDIHGQHEHQELMNASLHLHLLDQFGGKEIQTALARYKEVFQAYDQILKQINKLTENEKEMAHRLDLIQFQLKEIQSADLKIGEEEQLLEERSRLNNFEKLYEAMHTSYNALQGEQKGIDWIGLVMSQLEIAAEIDPSYEPLMESVSNSYYMLEDAAHSLRNEVDKLAYDPNRLNEIESRLNDISTLKRKYGATISDILEYSAKIEEEIETITNRESHLEKLTTKLESIRADLYLEAKQLSELRQKVAHMLTIEIHKQLKQLYMDKTVFDVRFHHAIENMDEKKGQVYQENGIDHVEFYISPNPGEPLKPLTKIASGGELSRIMLALKTIFSHHQGITSIIFDEIDTGVSGRVAQAIAEKIYKISHHSQVLCISHLPQVAAMADTHFYIAKEAKKDRTKTSVVTLNKEEKIKEIARMISGVEITDLTKKHAEELLELAYTHKK